MTATAESLGLTASQYRNALGIIAAVKARGWAAKAAVIAIETALTESGMRMIASANVPESQKYPHELLGWTSDGLGHDHASCGMFQQQTGYRWTPAGYGTAMNQTTMNSPDGWGTPAELMNAEKSTTKFLNALANVDWQHMDNWLAAQSVQHSAFPDGSNYRQMDSRAQRIVGALWSAGQLSEEDEMKIVQNADKQTAPLLLGQGDKPIVLTAERQSALVAAGVPVKRLHNTQYMTLRDWADGK